MITFYLTNKSISLIEKSKIEIIEIYLNIPTTEKYPARNTKSKITAMIASGILL